MVVTLSLLSATNLYSQQNLIRITGKVIDGNGDPVIGATIRVKNGTEGAITNIDGEYSIQAPRNGTLVYTYIGFKDMEEKVNPSGVMNVTMTENNQMLDEVVVVGYGTARKKDLTGGLSVVGQQELQMASTPNLMDRLTGQVAGLNITASNAAPGSDQALLIRGENSLSANNSPLIVLDGIPYSGALVDLDPNIIDNITVLKDASAVAIYGSRGSNGVILVQTKRGKETKAQVNYKGQFGFQEPMQRIQVMGPNEYIRLMQDIARLKKGYTGDQLDPIAGDIISQNEKEMYALGTTHDWQDYVFQTGYTMDHQVSISGGTESTKYMAAIAHHQMEGVVYNSNLTRTNITVNVDQTLNKWLTIGVGTQFVQRENGGVTPNLEHAIKQSPYGKYLDENGYYEEEPMEYPTFKNPMVNVNADQDRTNRNFFLNAYANIVLPIKGLSFRTNLGYNYRSSFTGTYYGRDTFDGKEQGGQVGGKATINNEHYNDYTWENVLRYEREIGKHRFDFTGLFSVQETQKKTTSQSGEGFVTDDTSYHMIHTAERKVAISSGFSETAMLSYMGRINYVLMDKYMATLTGRTDGASVFAKNNKYAFFPSAALAWHIGEENFIKDNVTWIDMLKLRVSYGANGNQAISAYRSLDRLYSKVKYIWGDGGDAANTAYLPADGIGNPNLKWETTYTANIGIDFQLLGNRLGGTIEVYQSNTHDLLMTRNVPIMNGYNKIYDNIGETQNRGIEITLNSQNIRNKKFTWSTDFNFSLNRDKIVELRGDGKDDVDNKWFIDHPLRVWYDYNVVGMWQEGDEFFTTDANGNQVEIQKSAAPGAAKLEDVNGNGVIDEDDKKPIGSKSPSFRMSMANRFTYKDFYMSFLVNGVFGVWRENNIADVGQWTFEKGNFIHNADYWTPENTGGKIVSPAYIKPFPHSFYKKQTYIQIKNITLGYRMPRSIVSKLGLTGIDMNLSVNNVHTFSNMRQILNYDNTWMASYPTARSYMFGLNLTF